MKKNIVLLYGGKSCEHDISILTALQTYNNINEYLYNIKLIYIDKNDNWKIGDDLKHHSIYNDAKALNKLKNAIILPNNKNLYYIKNNKLKKIFSIDCVIVCLHGKNGEDGSISGLLNLSNVAYTCSDIIGSSIGCDKVIFKNFINSVNIPNMEYCVINKNDYLNNKKLELNKILKTIKLPFIIKPANLGSSIGVKICTSLDSIENNLNHSFMFDNKLLIEKFISKKKEYNIAIYKNNNKLIFSEVEEPISLDTILSFDEKYLNNGESGFEGINRIYPANIDIKTKNLIKKYAGICYNELYLKGVVRFDFIFDLELNKLYLNEINTIPGSLSNYLFVKNKILFSNLIDNLINSAIFENLEKNNTISIFESKVLLCESYLKK